MTHKNTRLLGVILSGGRSQRMGSDKALLTIGNTILLDHVYGRLSLQFDERRKAAEKVEKIIVSSNNPVLLAKTDKTYLADENDFNNFGPLSGIYTTMKYAQIHDYEAIITVAVDTPFFPEDYIDRLDHFYKSNLNSAILSTYHGEYQPTFGLWPVGLIDDLKSHLQAGKRSIYSFAQKVDAKDYDFGDDNRKENENGFNPFFNINTPEDLKVAKSLWL